MAEHYFARGVLHFFKWLALEASEKVLVKTRAQLFGRCCRIMVLHGRVGHFEVICFTCRKRSAKVVLFVASSRDFQKKHLKDRRT